MTQKPAQAGLKNRQAEVKKMGSGYKKDQDSMLATDFTIKAPCVLFVRADSTS